MNELFGQLFGQQPSYAQMLLGEEEARRLQQQAQQQGLLNVGLSLLAGSGPSAQPRGIGQLLAQGVQAGQQAYQGAYNRALQEQAVQEQLQERRLMQAERMRALQEQQMAQQALPQVLRRPATEVYGEDIMGQRVGEGVKYGAPQLDLGALLSLPLGVQQRLMPVVSGAAEAIPKFRKAGLTGEGGAQDNPFLVFTKDPTVPQNVRTIAEQYAKSFSTGQLDPEKADERVRQLGEMVQRTQQFQTTQAGLEQQRATANILAKGQQDLQRMSIEDRIERAREKAAEKEQTKTEAKDQLTATVEQLKKNYDTLLQEGGIVSTEATGMANVGARLSSSGLGRAVGGAVGTKTQQQREAIEQTRPLLLNLIKNATGMSAQQMNSNAEMQLYLNAATNPNLSYEANMEALANLDRLFGLGSAAKKIEDQLKKDQGKGGQTRSGW
jgi:hypothetical protein